MTADLPARVELPGAAHPVQVWRGLRYARAARFEPPVLEPFEEGAAADEFGPAPFQVPPPVPPLGAPVDEDCHFLNVWAPRDEPSPLPVYFCVYGGGFEHGAGSSWACDGEVMASAGMVFVSFNYRVGALGFLSLNSWGGRLSGASNLGLQDVVTALRWVHENIARFGGDPQRVTVVGESAGGFLAAALPAVPAADGLYAGLAVHSAGASRIVPAERARAAADAVVHRLGLGHDPERILDVPAADLVRAQAAAVGTDIGARNGPVPQALGVVDDSAAADGVLELHPFDAVRGGRSAAVPLLVSATLDEIALFRVAAGPAFEPAGLDAVVAEAVSWGVSDARARRLVQDVVEAAGPAATAGDVRERLLTDYVYRLPVVRLAQAHAAAGGRAHLALVGRADAAPAGHACDVPGLVGRRTPGGSPAVHARDVAIAAAIARFVRDGDPGWPATGADVVAHGFADTGEPASHVLHEVLQRFEGVPRP